MCNQPWQYLQYITAMYTLHFVHIIGTSAWSAACSCSSYFTDCKSYFL
jgi:hypothetical protein